MPKNDELVYPIEETPEDISEETNINVLLHIPLNELTEEQADMVIQFRAESLFEDYKTSDTAQQIEITMQAAIDSYDAIAAESKTALKAIKKQALAFYENQ